MPTHLLLPRYLHMKITPLFVAWLTAASTSTLYGYALGGLKDPEAIGIALINVLAAFSFATVMCDRSTLWRRLVLLAMCCALVGLGGIFLFDQTADARFFWIAPLVAGWVAIGGGAAFLAGILSAHARRYIAEIFHWIRFGSGTA